jgi:hypothetical protein
MGEKGGSLRATLPYLLMEVSLKAAPAASILETKSHAPSPRSALIREQKGNPQLLPYPFIQNNAN